MRILNIGKPFLAKVWAYLVGDSTGFSMEEQSFHGICVISFAILLFLLPFNAVIGLWNVSGMMAILMLIICIVYYQARFRHRHTLGLITYGVGSYITLVLNYFMNSGSLGPTIFLFFLTFQLLIAFSKKQLHILWFVCHLLLAGSLLVIELWLPAWVPYTYQNKQGRLTDVISSYLCILVCMYLITIFLRNNYNRERLVAEERAKHILEQNEELEHLNAQKDRLFSVMAHDLRSPLFSISQLVEVLHSTQMTPQEQAVFMGHLKDYTVRTSDMLGNLLSWSYSQLEGVRVQLEPVKVYRVAETVLRVQRELANRKEISVVTAVDHLHEVMADNNMLEIVLRNLVNNAIKFTPAGGIITIATQVQAGICCISVTDTGMGISKENEANLFTLNLTSTRGTGNEKGVGLGLTLCKEFTELQSGRIEAASEQQKGSTFKVYLPVVVPET